MRMSGTALSFILLCTSFGTALAEVLPRRGDTGAAVAPPSDGKPARIVRFREGSVLERAGLRVGDEIVELQGVRLDDALAFERWRRLKSGPVQLAARRGAETLRIAAEVPPMRIEAIEGLEVRYGEAASAKGHRIRTYTSRPRGASGRLPVVVFIPWLSCNAAESPLVATDGWSRMLRDVMTGAGMQVVRLEKPGVGDSEGPDCAQADLEDDLAAFRAGIRAALADPGADSTRLYLFGGSIGGALVPVLARGLEVKGIIATGGYTRTWLEHMLDIERRRLTFSGKTPAEVGSAMRGFAGFYDRVLNGGLTPAQAIGARPEWKALWYDEPEHQYGRPIRYYQQLQRLDVEDAWHQVKVPTLVVWGEYDWIMGRDESERAVAIVRSRDPKLVTYAVRAGMNHHFEVFPDAAAAFKEQGGTYDAGAARVMVDWLRGQERRN
jgi:pimeloyl-ACP methyl ester carboxylesterase